MNGPGFDCSVDLETLEVLAGHAPAKALALARQWASQNREAVAKTWEELNK